MKHSNKRDPDFGALGLGKYLKNDSRLARDVKAQARIDREIAQVKSQKREARYVIFSHEHQAFWVLADPAMCKTSPKLAATAGPARSISAVTRSPVNGRRA
jgi:hypothetical protein